MNVIVDSKGSSGSAFDYVFDEGFTVKQNSELSVKSIKFTISNDIVTISEENKTIYVLFDFHSEDQELPFPSNNPKDNEAWGPQFYTLSLLPGVYTKSSLAKHIHGTLNAAANHFYDDTITHFKFVLKQEPTKDGTGVHSFFQCTFERHFSAPELSPIYTNLAITHNGQELFFLLNGILYKPLVFTPNDDAGEDNFMPLEHAILNNDNIQNFFDITRLTTLVKNPDSVQGTGLNLDITLVPKEKLSQRSFEVSLFNLKPILQNHAKNTPLVYPNPQSGLGLSRTLAFLPTKETFGYDLFDKRMTHPSFKSGDKFAYSYSLKRNKGPVSESTSYPEITSFETYTRLQVTSHDHYHDPIMIDNTAEEADSKLDAYFSLFRESYAAEPTQENDRLYSFKASTRALLAMDEVNPEFDTHTQSWPWQQPLFTLYRGVTGYKPLTDIEDITVYANNICFLSSTDDEGDDFRIDALFYTLRELVFSNLGGEIERMKIFIRSGQLKEDDVLRGLVTELPGLRDKIPYKKNKNKTKRPNKKKEVLDWDHLTLILYEAIAQEAFRRYTEDVFIHIMEKGSSPDTTQIDTKPEINIPIASNFRIAVTVSIHHLRAIPLSETQISQLSDNSQIHVRNVFGMTTFKCNETTAPLTQNPSNIALGQELTQSIMFSPEGKYSDLTEIHHGYQKGIGKKFYRLPELDVQKTIKEPLTVSDIGYNVSTFFMYVDDTTSDPITSNLIPACYLTSLDWRQQNPQISLSQTSHISTGDVVFRGFQLLVPQEEEEEDHPTKKSKAYPTQNIQKSITASSLSTSMFQTETKTALVCSLNSPILDTIPVPIHITYDTSNVLQLTMDTKTLKAHDEFKFQIQLPNILLYHLKVAPSHAMLDLPLCFQLKDVTDDKVLRTSYVDPEPRFDTIQPESTDIYSIGTLSDHNLITRNDYEKAHQVSTATQSYFITENRPYQFFFNTSQLSKDHTYAIHVLYPRTSTLTEDKEVNPYNLIYGTLNGDTGYHYPCCSSSSNADLIFGQGNHQQVTITDTLGFFNFEPVTVYISSTDKKGSIYNLDNYRRYTDGNNLRYLPPSTLPSSTNVSKINTKLLNASLLLVPRHANQLQLTKEKHRWWPKKAVNWGTFVWFQDLNNTLKFGINPALNYNPLVKQYIHFAGIEKPPSIFDAVSTIKSKTPLESTNFSKLKLYLLCPTLNAISTYKGKSHPIIASITKLEKEGESFDMYEDDTVKTIQTYISKEETLALNSTRFMTETTLSTLKFYLVDENLQTLKHNDLISTQILLHFKQPPLTGYNSSF